MKFALHSVSGLNIAKLFAGVQRTGQKRITCDVKNAAAKVSPKIAQLKEIATDVNIIGNNNNNNKTEASNVVVIKIHKKHSIESKLKTAVGNFVEKVAGLSDLIEKCSDLANNLRDDVKMKNAMVSECDIFDIEYKEVVVPDCWKSQIDCLKSVLNLKAPIFFAGERDEGIQRKCPTVEQIQLLEIVVPVLDKVRYSNEVDLNLIKHDLYQMEGDRMKTIASTLISEIEAIFS